MGKLAVGQARVASRMRDVNCLITGHMMRMGNHDDGIARVQATSGHLAKKGPV